MAFTHRQRRLSRESARRTLALLLLALLASASFANQSNDFSQDVKNAVDSSSRRARDGMKRLGKDSRAILDAKSRLVSLEASAMKLVNEIVKNTGKNITKPQKALTSVVRSVVSAVNVLKKAGLFRGGAYVKPKKSELNATADMAAFRAIQAQEINEVLALLSPSKALASTSASISDSGFSSSSGSGAGSNSSFNSGADHNSNSGSDFNSSSSSGSGSGPGSSPSSTNRLKTTTSVASLSSSRTGLRRAKPAEPEPCNGWICIDISITGIILALRAFYLALEGFIQGSIQGFVQIAAFLGAAFEAFFFALFNCKGATTMLFPMDALVWAGALTVLSGRQLAEVANYNMLDGLYPYDIIQSAGWMARFKTQLPDQTVTKVFGQGSPMVVLMGRLGIPSVVLWPNFYVGKSLIVHIVSTSLVPTLTS